MFEPDFDSYLSKLLVPRPPQSNHLNEIQNWVVQYFSDLDWNVELDTFEAMTPVGTKRFKNIIVTWNYKATRMIVLAAHLDSLPLTDFIGATDSAGPCAILMQIATKITPFLQRSGPFSLQLIFCSP